MEDIFYFLECTQEKIQNKNYLCIYILNYTKHVVFRIFKKYTDELYDSICSIEQFEDVSNRISFVIKRDGKVTLDIKI